MEMSGRKGILMTLITLILFLFMLAEILTYVSLSLNNNNMAMQLAQTESTSMASLELRYELYSFIHSSMMNAIFVIYYDRNDAIYRNITDQNSTASGVQQLVTTGMIDGNSYQSSIGITLGNYISSIENESHAQQEPISILNSTFRVFQSNPLSLTGIYTALAVIRSNGTESAYPISLKISVPSTSSFGQVYVGALPPEIVSYVPVKITNTQSSNTASPFQQEVIVNSSLYRGREAGNLDNIEFFYANDSIVHSWLESGNTNTSTNTTYWLNISAGISAHSSITVYMGFANLTTDLFNNQTTGEAPQLSSTYAQYDDGASVFNNYWNFAGTGLPSGLTSTSSTDTITVDDGLTVTEPTAGSGYAWILTGSIPAGQIIETDLLTSSSELNTRLGWSTSTSLGGQENPYSSYDNNIGGTAISGVWITSTSAGGIAVTPTVVTKQSGIFSFAWLGTGSQWYSYNYQKATSSDTTLSIATDLYGYFGVGNLAYSSGTTDSQSIYWLRTRAYPPNGVMPTAVVGG
ncbi:MAG: hypothetical protein M1562_02250 [Candidatus Marsarchaeota archaeon]|jgi:hypothetical protein|nr:hypothetical protein [Candidatus Marsarchaeota archaeon]